MTIYLFDMDGTLTIAGRPMSADFATFFHRWQQTHKSYLVTGGRYDRITKRMTPEILNSFSGIYASMGNELIVRGKIIYQKEFEPAKRLYQELENYRKNTSYPYELYPNYIEKRPGMVNFSVLGRNCPDEARSKYTAWDHDSKERERIINELIHLFPQYDITRGGPISVDVMPKNCGKEQVAYHLRKLHPDEEIIFTGDQTSIGGNDYKLAQTLSSLGNTRIVQVNHPDDVLKFLQCNDSPL